MKRITIPLLASIMLGACSQAAPVAGDASESAAAPATESSAASTVTSPIASAFDDYLLTQANVDAFFAAQSGLAAAVEADPELDPAMNASEEDNDAYAARLENTPALRSAIAEAGLSTRDYAWTSEHLMGALMAHAALEKGLIKALPEGVSQRNVDFIRTNRARIQARMQALQD